MEKTAGTPKGEPESNDAPPATEPNGADREEERAHAHEPERVVEWGGPNNRYGKVRALGVR